MGDIQLACLPGSVGGVQRGYFTSFRIVLPVAYEERPTLRDHRHVDHIRICTFPRYLIMGQRPAAFIGIRVPHAMGTSSGHRSPLPFYDRPTSPRARVLQPPH
ncbi:hypothetical protein MRX96_008859 [Rhipicephalus microplus]